MRAGACLGARHLEGSSPPGKVIKEYVRAASGARALRQPGVIESVPINAPRIWTFVGQGLGDIAEPLHSEKMRVEGR
jgi:hypothetical protein